uniref:Uncharacterized protein n=1 Tax=Timema poppense TaxID=170557 RepID=A0A7R9DAY5_TIMPO|nr:unnamed protein product [Timema poppensis]
MVWRAQRPKVPTLETNQPRCSTCKIHQPSTSFNGRLTLERR